MSKTIVKDVRRGFDSRHVYNTALVCGTGGVESLGDRNPLERYVFGLVRIVSGLKVVRNQTSRLKKPR